MNPFCVSDLLKRAENLATSSGFNGGTLRGALFGGGLVAVGRSMLRPEKLGRGPAVTVKNESVNRSYVGYSQGSASLPGKTYAAKPIPLLDVDQPAHGQSISSLFQTLRASKARDSVYPQFAISVLDSIFFS